MEEKASGKAIASLVFGILGLVGACPCLGSIAAIVLGLGETSGVGRAGVVLGWIGLFLNIVLPILILMFVGCCVAPLAALAGNC